jgi:hypothetical protein
VALGIQSLGYRRYYDQLFKQTGMQKGFLTDLFFRAEDRKKAYRQQYYRLTRVKVSRMRKLFKKLREGNKKMVQDRRSELTYSSGMMLETTNGGDENRTSGKFCKWCKLTTHSRVTNALCPMNRANLAEAAEAAEGSELTSSRTVMAREPEESSSRNGKRKQCSACNLTSHQRPTHKLCPKNKMNLAKAAKAAKNKHETEGKYDN